MSELLRDGEKIMGSVQRRWDGGLLNRITTDTTTWQVLDYKFIEGEWLPCLLYSPDWELWLVDRADERQNRVDVFEFDPRCQEHDVASIEIPIWDHAAGRRADEWSPGTVALLERVDDFLADGWRLDDGTKEITDE